MLEMARNLQAAKSSHAYEEILTDKILFYGLTKMIEIIGCISVRCKVHGLATDI